MNESEAMMELLRIAHKLSNLIWTGDDCEQAYINELWETEGAPDDVRVTWPEEFEPWF